MTINPVASAASMAASLTAQAASGSVPDGDGDHGVEPAAGSSQPALPSNSTISRYA